MTGPHLTLTTAGAWVDDALCAQVDAAESFFPERGGSSKEAKKVCNGDKAKGTLPCPVRAECLKFAMDTHENFGVWGGHSERERRALRAKEPRAALPSDAVCPECGEGFKGFKGLAGHRNGRGECATQRKAAVA